MAENSVERVSAGESRIAELEKEVAFLQRELELQENPDILFLTDKYNSARYWRERCLAAENALGVLGVKYTDLRNRQASE